MEDKYEKLRKILSTGIPIVMKSVNWNLSSKPEQDQISLCAEIYELLEERDRLIEEVEVERMKVVACGVAATQNTEFTRQQRIPRDNPYYSASYADVCNAVDREMELRSKVETIADLLREEDE